MTRQQEQFLPTHQPYSRHARAKRVRQKPWVMTERVFLDNSVGFATLFVAWLCLVPVGCMQLTLWLFDSRIGMVMLPVQMVTWVIFGNWANKIADRRYSD